MNIHFAVKSLGGDVASRDTVLCPGPGHTAADRSLSVTFDADAPDGFLVNSFANDDWQDCRDHVRTLLGLGSFGSRGEGVKVRLAARPAMPDADAIRKREIAGSLWQEARPIGGTIAERYLAGRNIRLTEDARSGDALRFHPACPFRLESGDTVRLPAMLASMVNIATNAFQGIHRTALQPDGSGKATLPGLHDPRKMLGSNKGACVKLSPDAHVTRGLGIAEGLETALSVIGNFGFSPVWSLLTAGALARFPVLPGIECLSIFADNDHVKNGKQAGTEAARQCSSNWTGADRECAIWSPPDIGSDFNDLTGRIAA